MSNQNSLNEQKEGALLTPQERQVCQQISTGEAPHSQRAQALLALDEGATQTQAGQQVGLTRSQVKYWLGQFRRERLDAFPEGVFVEAPAAPKGPEDVVLEEVEVAVESAQEDQTAKKS
ncbi:MAG: helix-turn-helix domain-containing protein, partial [Anaerolineales bacterium]|nr:helix-turn-helix domain-containing protein [Anaerolineales bacterium]